MSDFELQRRLRALNEPRAPTLDAWPAIERRIASAPVAQQQGPARRRRRLGWPLAAAAAALLAVTGALLFAVQRAPGGIDRTITSVEHAAATSPIALRATRMEPGARAAGGDPRLAGAAVVLDSAHAELEQALERRPDAVFLVSLLNRTNARRMKLDRFGADAG